MLFYFIKDLEEYNTMKMYDVYTKKLIFSFKFTPKPNSHHFFMVVDVYNEKFNSLTYSFNGEEFNEEISFRDYFVELDNMFSKKSESKDYFFTKEDTKYTKEVIQNLIEYGPIISIKDFFLAYKTNILKLNDDNSVNYAITEIDNGNTITQLYVSSKEENIVSYDYSFSKKESLSLSDVEKLYNKLIDESYTKFINKNTQSESSFIFKSIEKEYLKQL